MVFNFTVKLNLTIASVILTLADVIELSYLYFPSSQNIANTK